MAEKKTPQPGKPAKKLKKASAGPARKTAKRGAAARKTPGKRTAKAPALEQQADLGPVDAHLEADADIATRKPKGRAPVILVGIGSSAGGLEALKELVASLPTEQNLSYVVAQHLSPTHTSLLQELLRPETELGVGALKDATIPLPNTIYVTPPNQDVVYANGMLRLNQPQASVGPKPSVDLFLKSLAENHGDNTVAIILSGTGTDGAAGVRAVKAAGGAVLVQDPQLAKYDGMPRAAIQTSCADLVLAAGKMGEVLSGIAEAPANMRLPVQEDEVSGSYAKIASGVKRHTGFDLTHYKFATVNRRLIRRMSLHKSTSFDDYAELLRSDREEAQQMVKDVLISVTSFFRDEEAFDILRRQLRKLVAERASDDVIRIWIAGCATGEEAYSMAIMMSEAVREHGRGPEFLIFATDLDAPAVNFARNGAYPEASVEQLPKQLVETYFEHSGKVYQVRKFLRQNMVFAVQNLIEDPPFSRMDLISCRNLLIYLNRPVQRRLLEVFHYALKPNGLLFLGKSESIELHKELFADLDKKAKLYKRQAAGGSNSYSLRTRSPQRPSVTEEARQTGGHRSQDYQSAAFQLVNALADQLCPPAVVISDDDDAMHFVGELKPFLRFPRGPAELKIFDLVHEPIRGELRALIHRARREHSRQQGTVFSVEIDGDKRSFTPTVNTMSVDKKAVVVLYFEPAAKPAFEAVSSEAGDRDSLIIDELERELATTRQHLQTVVDELETSNEALLSQFEELQSANEELQSTNEELQTSNEELQSTNEELLTVNDELQREQLRLRLHAEMLAITNEQSDPQKLLNEAVDAAFRYYPECRFSVCVPQDQGYRSVYSRQPAGVASIAGRELDLGPLIADLDRPEAAATLPLELPEPAAREILGNAALPQRKDIVLFDGSRVIGVMSMEHRKNTGFAEDEQANFASLCELLALKIRDASSARSQGLSSQSLAEHKFRLETALNSIADGIITTDPNGQVDYMNPAAVHLTGHRQVEAIGQHLNHIFKLVAAADNRPVSSPIATALADKKIVDRMQQDCFLVHREGRKSVVQCSAAPFVDGEDRVTGGILVFRDVTDQNLLAAELSFRASHDPLTGLINRDEFDRRLKTATVEARRTGQTHVICYLDIDQFKVINDTCGHTAGDELLKQLAELLRAELRQSDTLARLGGDEFGILMSNCDLGRGEEVVKGLLVKVREFRFNWQEAKFRPRVSIGVVSVDKDSKSVATILSQVDAACFTAKEAGRDRYYLATGADDTTIRQHGEMQLVSKIAHALEHDLFQLKLEDVVELDGKQRKVFYREVLLRLDGEDGKPMDITEIVPAAERYLLMSSIDRWVVRRTLGLLAKRQDQSGCIFAINLSGQTLGEEQSLSFILRQIEEFDVDPSRLCFEITETAAVTHLSEAVRFMETLSEKGVQFALDDFGSGLASFAYLKQLPVQFLKIDGSFVRGLPDNNFDRTMVAAIQRIGEEIGLKTIAEHAENETIIAALEDLGIRYIQGYALGEGEFLTA